MLHWLIEAAEHLRAFSAYFLGALHVKQLQLDELYAVLSAVKDGEITEAKAITRLSRSPQWVGRDGPREQIAPHDRGRRSHPGDGSTRGPPRRAGSAPDCAPLFVTDGFRGT